MAVRVHCSVSSFYAMKNKILLLKNAEQHVETINTETWKQMNSNSLLLSIQSVLVDEERGRIGWIVNMGRNISDNIRISKITKSTTLSNISVRRLYNHKSASAVLY